MDRFWIVFYSLVSIGLFGINITGYILWSKTSTFFGIDGVYFMMIGLASMVSIILLIPFADEPNNKKIKSQNQTKEM